MSKIHYKTISTEQQKLLEELGSLNFGVLVGGTALSLQVGHRKSYDLDFVVKEKLSDEMQNTIQASLSKYHLNQRLSSKTQYTAFADSVKITFFQDVAPLLYQRIQLDKFKLASPKDIFSSKLYIMGRRATWRDYVDVAVCLDQKICQIEQGIKDAVKRYQVNSRWILEPLSYFDDLELTPIEWVGKAYTDDEIKQIIIHNVKNYLQAQY